MNTVWLRSGEVPRIVKFSETETEQSLPGAGGGEKVEDVEFSPKPFLEILGCDAEKVLEVGGGGGCTTMEYT